MVLRTMGNGDQAMCHMVHVQRRGAVKRHTFVDTSVGTLVNSRLPIAKGERGQLREKPGDTSPRIVSYSKEVLAMSCFARPISTYTRRRLPWGFGTTVLFPREVLR